VVVRSQSENYKITAHPVRPERSARGAESKGNKSENNGASTSLRYAQHERIPFESGFARSTFV